MIAPRVRLYESALNDVIYVYRAPVSFSRDPNLLEARDADKHKGMLAAFLRAERAGR